MSLWNSDWLRGTFGGGAEDRAPVYPTPPPPESPPRHEDRRDADSELTRSSRPAGSERWPGASSGAAGATSQVENDAAIAQSIAQAEQEERDREFAQRLAQQDSGPRMPGARGAGSAQRLMQMRCGRCQSAVSVIVPASSPVGTIIRAPCNRCSAMNEFAVPPGVWGGSGPGSTPHSDVRSRGPVGSPGFSGPPGPSASDFAEHDLIHVVCEIGDTAVEMMVDTGAQSSVISQTLAQRLNLMSRLDRSRQGMASGVGGNARIIGRLRRMPVRLGHVEFDLDFTVLGVDEEMLMLGIDQLRRFKVIVDLDKQRLVFGGSDGVPVPFLPPSQQRWTYRGAGCPQM